MFSSLASFIFGTNTSATTTSETDNNPPRQANDEQQQPIQELSADNVSIDAEDTIIQVTSSTPSVAGSGPNSISQKGKRRKNRRHRKRSDSREVDSDGEDVHKHGAGEQNRPTLPTTETPIDSFDDSFDEDEWFIVEKGDGEETLPRSESEEELSIVELKPKAVVEPIAPTLPLVQVVEVESPALAVSAAPTPAPAPVPKPSPANNNRNNNYYNQNYRNNYYSYSNNYYYNNNSGQDRQRHRQQYNRYQYHQQPQLPKAQRHQQQPQKQQPKSQQPQQQRQQEHQRQQQQQHQRQQQQQPLQQQHINPHSHHGGAKPKQPQQQKRNNNYSQKPRPAGHEASGSSNFNLSRLSPPRSVNGVANGAESKPADGGVGAQSLYVVLPNRESTTGAHNTSGGSSNSSFGANISMEESWFVTPPPCFTSIGPIHMETSPFENLLIEHPSMSVYHSIRSAQEATESFINLDLGVNESQPMEQSPPKRQWNRRQRLQWKQRSPRTLGAPGAKTAGQKASGKAAPAKVAPAKVAPPPKPPVEEPVVPSVPVRISPFAVAHLKQELSGNPKIYDKKDRQKLCRGALKRANKVRDVQSKGNRQRRADLQHSRFLSRANNNRKCC